MFSIVHSMVSNMVSNIFADENLTKATPKAAQRKLNLITRLLLDSN